MVEIANSNNNGIQATQLAFHGMGVDLELRKKLKELLDILPKLEELKSQESNPIRRDELEKNILSVKELIGVIRYHSLDDMGILSKGEREKVD